MTVPCTQCGGSVQTTEGDRFATCSYCGSALYIDKSKVVFHFVVMPTITMDEARGKLKRWMAGNETAKDLDVHSQVTHEEMLYFPMWRFVSNDGSGSREFSEMAGSFAIPEIKSIPLSGGSLKYFAPKEFEGLHLKEPEVLMESALHWMEQRGIPRTGLTEANLIHIPFYHFRYQYNKTLYQSVVDGVSGRVLSSIFPPKTELPFVGLAISAALFFFVAGLIAPNVFWRLLIYILLLIPFSIGSYVVVRNY